MKLNLRAIRPFLGPIVLVGLIVLMLQASLFSGGKLVPTASNTDLHMYFLQYRYFGFSQWMKGEFPFWNPHVFCGIPFFAQLQSNLLYPITWINFLLNVASATTMEIAADLCVAALCAYFWARQRGISRCGSTLAGAIFTFSGPVYLRVMAGHISPLASVAWTPLLFLAVDWLLAERWRAGILIGSAAVCLQCLGGYPQYAYFAMLVAATYLLLESIGRRKFWRLYLAFAAIYLLAGMLAAAQMIPAYFSSQLSIRAGGPSYTFSSAFSFPPENLLTLLIPYPLGDSLHRLYVGRWYLWEMSAYCGIINLALAGWTVLRQPRWQRWRTLTLLIITVLLMLGSYTPLHWWLYHYLPGFGTFRGASKFAAMLALLIAVLAAEGFDNFKVHVSNRAVAGAALFALVCFLAGAVFFSSDPLTGPTGRLLHLIFHSGQYMNFAFFQRPGLTAMMQTWIGSQWFLAAGLLLATSALLYAGRKRPDFVYLLLILAIAEVYCAAAFTNKISTVALGLPPQWQDAVKKATDADQRVIFADSADYGNANLPDAPPYNSVWGYDPGQPKRYTELIARSQGDHPASPDVYGLDLKRVSRIFQLLRCTYLFRWDPRQQIVAVPDPMPHLKLISRYIKTNKPDSIPDLLADSKFDFQRIAVLETTPQPAPSPASVGGTVTLIHQTINDLEIQADVPAPALLLITDAYAPGWRVRSLESSAPQSHYEILPADYVLRAIPLSAGHHHFDLYYTPPGLWAGIILSTAGVLLFVALAAWHLRVAKNRSAQSPGPLPANTGR